MNALAEANAILDAKLSAEALPPLRDGAVLINGKEHLADPKGRWTNIEFIKPAALLEDETVRKIVAFARELSATVARFKIHTLDDVAALKALLFQEYGVEVGGEKGNITISSYDQLNRVELKVADLTEFGPQLQAARSLLNECIRDWQDGADPRLVALVETAFQVDQEGQINRSNLLYLTRMHVEDAKWQRAMEAIRDAERPIGTKEYLRIQVRPDIRARWTTITIDLAAA